MKKLILGMAVGLYSHVQYMEHFVRSLRKHYDYDVCLITDNPDDAFHDWFVKYNVELVLCDKKLTPESVMYRRWSLPKEVIETNYQDYDLVLLPDTRDVIFQDDPFRFFSDLDLQLSVETKTLEQCLHFNTPWVKSRYGEESYQKLKQEMILCAGITGGKKDAILWLCELMGKEHKRLGAQFVDQAALNVLSRENWFPSHTLHYTGDEGIATIGHSLGPCTVVDGVVCGVKGMIPAIVHQYDRHPSIAPIIMERALT